MSWLGVSFYLTRDAVAATLAALGGLAAGTELVVEYALPPELRDGRGQAYAAVALRVADERGEPWRTFLTPEDLSALMRAHGLEVIEQVRQRDAIEPGLWRRSDVLRPGRPVPARPRRCGHAEVTHDEPVRHQRSPPRNPVGRLGGLRGVTLVS